MSSEILRLPDEPPVGAIVELLDGSHQGDRYRRDDKGWMLLAPYIGRDDEHRWSWSEIWWAVTEDGVGGTQVRVTIPDPDNPHPLPWRVSGNNIIWDASGDRVPLEFAVATANKSVKSA
jgi:hypothetical protein